MDAEDEGDASERLTGNPTEINSRCFNSVKHDTYTSSNG